MRYDRVMDKVLAQKGVHSVFILDDATNIRMELEESKHVGIGSAYENRGLIESRNRELRICVFSDGFLEAPTEMMTVLIDSAGRIFGHDVPEGMPRSKIREGGFWVSSYFVMYADSIPTSELKFVVVPHSVNFIGEAEGVRDVIAYNPSRDADVYLRKAFGFEGPSGSMSTIIAMNYTE